MTTRVRLRSLALLVSVTFATPLAAQEWTWIQGEYEGADEQARYEEFAQRMFDYYQGRGAMKGKLVKEADLESAPDRHVVHIGPLDVFEHPEWIQSWAPLELGSVTKLAGVELSVGKTGIYLRSPSSEHFLFTGLSRAGFESIFAVHTGRRDCTVTVDGMLRYEGDWSEGALVIEALPYLPIYPKEEELSDLAQSDAALVTSDVYAGNGDLTPGGKERLHDLVEGQRVLFVGESHWNRGVNELYQAFLEELFTHRPPRALFFEYNYSFSGHWDYYCSLADDKEAQDFHASALKPLVNTPTLMAHLESVRCFNRDHPDEAIRIATLDMEWSDDHMLRSIVEPYMQYFEPDFRLAGTRGEAWEQARAEIVALLEIIEEEQAVGPYPFQTTTWMRRILQNHADTLAIEDSRRDRQKWILRNVTEFHGELFDEGLVVFKGGGFHAVRAPRNDVGFYREAAYLDKIFEPTRGKVRTIWLAGLGTRFDEVADLDLGRILSNATNYRNFVGGYQRGLSDGSAEEGVTYLIDGGDLHLFERLIARRGYERETDVLWIDGIDRAKLAPPHRDQASAHRLEDYDAVIYCLRSQMETTLLRD